MAPAERTAASSRRVHHITPKPTGLGMASNLWATRDLVAVLAHRDIKVRYTQTALGVAWAVVQPLLFVTVFVVLIARLGSIPTGGVPYWVFALAGVVPWVFLSNAVPRAAESVVSSSNMVAKVWLPRLVLPLAAVLAWLPDLVVGGVLLALALLVTTMAPPVGVVLLPLVVVWGLLVALGFGSWLSALNVRYRDIRNVVPFLVQLWLFVTPVAYPASFGGPRLRLLLALNPASGFVETFRWCALGTNAPSIGLLLISGASTVVLLLTGILYFSRVEHRFADVI